MVNLVSIGFILISLYITLFMYFYTGFGITMGYHRKSDTEDDPYGPQKRILV
jgi:hypothetical protein